MRSSIACAKCRRSKVKCINNGVNTTCRACEASGRECIYRVSESGPPPAVTGRGSVGGLGALPPTNGASRGETPRRPRAKKLLAHASSYSAKESPRPLLDALDPNVLTPKVWTELFEIFELHFSTDLPFLHRPTFLKPLRQASLQASSADSAGGQPSSSLPPASPLLLLSFLALTARFHDKLIAHHAPATSSRPSNPLVASEYYAAAARRSFNGEYSEGLGTPTLERVQSLLMMGLHDWGMCQGSKAWVSIGVAIRMAQVLGLQFEQELDDMPLARSLALNTEVHHLDISPDRLARNTIYNKGDEFIEQEIRRRTFWSCFIMDRYLSSGKYRPSMLSVQDLRIQLPSSERAFMFGEKVRTALLGDDMDSVSNRAQVEKERIAGVMLGTRSGDRERSQELENSHYSVHDPRQGSDERDGARWELNQEEGVLSRFIRALDLYGTIVKWSCAGGRRQEAHPPWDSRSIFYTLHSQLTAFKDALPRHLTLTPQNISAHIASHTSTPYTLMHTLHLLCSIMLHREYVPFIPLRCSKPQGPLDPPLFPPEQYQIPSGFWDDSARKCFKAARDLIDLLRTCQEWQVLVETPIVGFAMYTVAFVGIYCINFPWMDPHGYMSKRAPTSNGVSASVGTSGAEATGKAVELVRQMRPRLKMAEGWFKTIQRVHRYFIRIKKDFHRNTRALEASSESGSSSESYRNLSLREGGAGGGLEEYKLLEKILKEFGSLEDEDSDMPDADSDANTAHLGDGLDETSEAGSAAVKSEHMDVVDHTQESASIRQERWNAINSVAAAATRAEATGGHGALSNGQMPNPYHQPVPSPTQGPAAPLHSDFRVYGSPQTASHVNPHMQTYSLNPPDSTQRASMSLHHLQGHATVAPPPPQPTKWSPQSREAWLSNLNTQFGGDDIAAFAAGEMLDDWATMQAKEPGPGGWFSAVWHTQG